MVDLKKRLSGIPEGRFFGNVKKSAGIFGLGVTSEGRKKR
jgi:hypothetical protein